MNCPTSPEEICELNCTCNDVHRTKVTERVGLRAQSACLEGTAEIGKQDQSSVFRARRSKLHETC